MPPDPPRCYIQYLEYVNYSDTYKRPNSKTVETMQNYKQTENYGSCRPFEQLCTGMVQQQQRQSRLPKICFSRPKGRKMKPKVVYHHENLDEPNRCFVRLYELYMSPCPVDCPADSFYLMPLQNPSGIPAGHLDTINLAPQLLTSTSQLEYQGTKPIILSGSLLLQNCMTQGLTSSWSWRLLDIAVQKVFVRTKGHLKPSVKAVSDILSVRRICVQHSIPPEQPQSSEIVLIQGSLLLLNSQRPHLQPSRHHLLSIHAHLSPSILTPIPSFLNTYTFSVM